MKMAMLLDSAAFVDGYFIPVSNDSFYHATRILDAAIGSRGFYQFDDMIHVPDGSWITWPWAYDYLLAKALVVALWFVPNMEPMKFLAYVPVFWTFVNSGLFLLVCRASGLGIGFSAIALFAFSLLPTNQLLHGLGIIDHHYIELSFTLLSIWLALQFFGPNTTRLISISLGVVLGIAPAFHNGLFILQIPVLVLFFLLWLRRQPMNAAMVGVFSIALIIGILLAVLPSGPFQDFQFEFGTLSWFHLYVAVCTASCAYFLSLESNQFTGRKFAILAVIAAILAMPLIWKILQGVSFVGGSTEFLQQIVEVKSPLQMYRDAGNSLAITRYYSWLIVLSPIVLVIFSVQLIRQGDANKLCIAVFVTFALLLLMAQFRFHPYGSWALIVGPLLLIDKLARKARANQLLVFAVSVAVVGIALQPVLKYQLFEVYPAGLTKDYAAIRSLFPVLKSACVDDPGVALSYRDDGHPIRYHSNCSVIANNFLLTEQHVEKAEKVDQLLDMTPQQLVLARPDIRYVVARFYGLFNRRREGYVPASLDEVESRNVRLFSALLLDREVPQNFELLGELRVDDDRNIPFARIFKVNPK